MKNRVQQFFPFIALLLGVVASAMVFLPVLKYADFDTTYTGIQVITGVDVFNIGPVADGKLPFSILALFAFALPLVAGILSVSIRRGYLVSAILFVVAAILLFVLPQYTNVNVTTFLGGTTEWEVEWVYQIGLILAGSLSIAGALASSLAVFQESQRA